MGVVKAAVVVVVGNPEPKMRERVKSLLEDIYPKRPVGSLSLLFLSLAYKKKKEKKTSRPTLR